ncbi:MAG: DUF2752 domain-containing protein [Oscillospiraceae bacterium]|nr:DUF2752 domain-containing protein [Oscillospiraceae bacterium]
MRNLAATIRTVKRAAPTSFSLFVALPCLFLTGYLFARLYFRQSLFSLWPCWFRAVTGFYCPACGSTRAVRAMINFSFVESLRFNPFPLLASALLLAVWTHSFCNVMFKRRDRTFRLFFIPFYAILAVGLGFCVLRNLAIL